MQEFIRRVNREFPASSNEYSALPQATDPAKAKGRNLIIKYEKKAKSAQKSEARDLSANRKKCGCFGTEHSAELICSCCGRILCAIEGEGECFFCGSFVTLKGTSESQEFLQERKRIAQNALEKSRIGFTKEEWEKRTDLAEEAREKAIAHKDKLLGFARDSAVRTRVIDDQEDYYELEDIDQNIWIDEAERQALEAIAIENEQRAEELIRPYRAPIKLTLDFASKRIIQESNPQSMENLLDEISDPVNQSSLEIPKAHTRVNKESYYRAGMLDGKAKQVYEQLQLALQAEKEKRKNVLSVENDQNTSTKDTQLVGKSQTENSETIEFVEKEELNVKDRGMCLSMHQPWASLLIAGIKRYEGREWSTDYRGRLWIASTAKVPSQLEISSLQEDYAAIYESEHVSFPENYPTSALLGCVDLTDCLSNEQFQDLRRLEIGKGIPIENSVSKFLFVCKNPRKLLLPQKISGQHKIWKLDPETLKSASKGLLK